MVVMSVHVTLGNLEIELLVQVELMVKHTQLFVKFKYPYM